MAAYEIIFGVVLIVLSISLVVLVLLQEGNSKGLSGAIAGLGGALELLGTQFRLINGFAAGYGFDGVAMALIASLHPLTGILVAVFFAALRVGSTMMQTATGVPTSVSDIIQALVIVFTVAGLAMVRLTAFRNLLTRRARKEA